MNILAVLVLGLLIGWLVEWTIDWFYWRNRFRPVAEENASLKEHITSLEAERNKRRPSKKSRLLTDEAGNDNLQAIKGIGPAFSKRLNEAGINTFEQLSNLTPQELEETLGSLYKRFFSKQESIRAQAREFAQLKAQLS
jgi:predicted flap endonuclease-1-like 5' DNA nuclease